MKTEKYELRKLTNTAIFTALVFVATFAIRITIPATGGYFNLGDSMIFVAALLYGPFVGAFSGGIGAALSDALGWPIYVPGTLIIKFIEGAIVGYVGRKVRPKPMPVTFWRALSVFLGLVLGAGTYFIGTGYMAVFGNALLDEITWAVMAAFLGAFIIFMSFMPGTKISWQTTSIVLGGTGMVIGYFLYENLLAILFPGLGVYAVGEIPLNIGQMLVGMAIALPILRAVQRAMPYETNAPP